MTVLYLSYDGLTDPLGQSQILPYIIGLSKLGYTFTVISFEKEKAFNKLEKEIRFICLENNIDWRPERYHKEPPVLSTIYDTWVLWRLVKSRYRQGQFQIIHCRSYITSLIGLRAKRKWNIRFIFDMRGFWADERVEGGLWNLKNPLFKTVYQYFKKKEREFLESADHIVSLTQNAKIEIESWGFKTELISVIPTCVDLDLFDPAKIREEDKIGLRKKLGIAERDFVLIYLGSWGTWYLINEMMYFFSVLREENAKSKFLIVSEDRIDVNSYSFNEDIIHVASGRQSVPLYISIANLSVCFIKSTFSKKASSATKLNEIMAMNIPVVTNSGWGDINLIDNHSLIVCDDITSRDCISAILERVKFRDVNGRGENDSFSLSKGISSYSKIYDDAVRKTF